MDDESGRDAVRVREAEIVFPTYPVPDADPNPMFLEKRVYQGSSGKVYPNPFTDRVSLHKVEKSYRAIFLENEFIELMILPEIGGRIHTGLDKTNRYDFIYRQNVVKPALVGLLGPWISGGVEFNWPQHHRPSTYMPVHASTEQHEDGSCTVWLSEHDPMLRMKGMVGIHLAPGKAMVEARVRLYNRTPLPQTFLWWANVAVRVHDQYQSFFPPDVTFVADHAKRAISTFPEARNLYYGVDYRPGTDISWYKNIPVPTSYMITSSRYDFCGGYDHSRKAGIVHTSNHHVAPGKKMWTWGNHEFGHAWDRNLTDEDGPYVELMAGAYTENQPDFSWLQPYETKSFSQFWYPIQLIGPAKNANTEAALNLEIVDERVRIGVCLTSAKDVRLLLTCREQTVAEWKVRIDPGKPFLAEINAANDIPEEFRLAVYEITGEKLIDYQPEKSLQEEIPGPATEPPAPEQIGAQEELYLTGLHLEQYRHATRSPETYWNEGLERDPDDIRMNNAMGLLCFRKGEFASAEEYFARAVRRQTFRNPNPYDGEPYYNLGLSRFYQGKLDEAYSAFHKAVWNYAWQSCGYYALASISSARGDLAVALEQVERSLSTNVESLQSRALQAALLRRMGRTREATAVISEALAIDPLDLRMKAERFLLSCDEDDVEHFISCLDGDVQSLLDLAFDLTMSGMRADALSILRSCSRAPFTEHPMYCYTMSWIAGSLKMDELAHLYAVNAEAASPRYCFPARLEEMIVLEDAIRRDGARPKAQYYLGNLYYDKRRYNEAIACWHRSVEMDGSFSIPWRNLGIAEFNVLHNPEAASRMYANAFAANSNDARLLYEWDQLKKRASLATPQERLGFLSQRRDLVACRDDLSVEYATLLNQTGEHESALELLTGRRFSPWEGGEGLVSMQYVASHRAMGEELLGAGDAKAAFDHFEAARKYPENLGEGKHLLTLERDLDYLSGLAMRMLGDLTEATRYWKSAAAKLPAIGISSYYQALALRELGREEEAKAIFANLVEFANDQMRKEIKIDYFATSLPNLLLFDDDLNKRNRNEMEFLSALGKLGLGLEEAAVRELQMVLREDPNHLLATELLQRLSRAAQSAAAIERA